MPTYDYACTECDHRFENFQSITSDPLTECPECEGKVRRLIGRGGALIFKGSGFYETDYKRNGKEKPGAKGESKGEAGSESKSASSESKSESKSESNSEPKPDSASSAAS